MTCEHRNTIVTDSRVTRHNILPRRRRKCTDCGLRFSTIEVRGDKSEADIIYRLQRRMSAIQRILDATNIQT